MLIDTRQQIPNLETSNLRKSQYYTRREFTLQEAIFSNILSLKVVFLFQLYGSHWMDRLDEYPFKKTQRPCYAFTLFGSRLFFEGDASSFSNSSPSFKQKWVRSSSVKFSFNFREFSFLYFSYIFISFINFFFVFLLFF